jgi:ribosome-binding protein aMBF1 (putative translation factor)
MSHQDWNPVVFNNKNNLKEENNKVKPPSIIHSEPKVKLTNDGEEIITIKNVTKTMSDIIKAKRNELKLTQKELAQKCNLDVKIINDIEKGGCIYNAQQINIIAKILNTKIPRK